MACPRLLLSAFLLSATGLAGCIAERSSPTAIADLVERQPDQQSWNVEYYLGEDGRQRSLLSAPHMARFEERDSTVVVLQGSPESRVHVRVFGADSSESDVSALEIRFTEDRQVYHLVGEVVVSTSSGRTLRTEQLVWDEAAHTISSDGFVAIETEDRTLQGYGLEADEMLDSFTLHRAVGRFYVDDE